MQSVFGQFQKSKYDHNDILINKSKQRFVTIIVLFWNQFLKLNC